MSTLLHAPALSHDVVQQLLADHYGMSNVGQCRSLPSDRDQNFLVEFEGARYVLKISNALEEGLLLEAQNGMMTHLAELGICPAIQNSVDGNAMVQVPGEGERKHFVRLVSYVEGQTLGAVHHRSQELLQSLGQCIGRMDALLSNFEHPALHYDFDWDLANGQAVVQKHVDQCDDPELVQWIEQLVAQVQKFSQPHFESLPKSVIHNDANDGNVLVSSSLAHQPANRVCGVIDFGDAIYSWTVGNLAIAIAYAILESPDPLTDAVTIVKAYHAQRPMTVGEVDALYGLVCLRLCVSACMAAQQTQIRPDDEYLNISQQPIRATLPKLVDIPFLLAGSAFRMACGFPATDQTSAIVDWLSENRERFSSVLATQPDRDNLVLVDWSVESEIQDNVLELDLDLADRKIADLLDGGKIGVGRYLEPRLIYASEQFNDSSGSERRTIHLGVDLFADAGTEIYAPYEGTVEVLHRIDKELDYGTLVILRHETDQGHEFYTLYGHLDWDSTSHLTVGQSVSQGSRLARLGSREVNGGWTPHLHFQIMLDRLEFENDFPGVAPAAFSEVWAQWCPDPNLMLGLPSAMTTYHRTSKAELGERRRNLLGGSLSLGYRDPVHLVRGRSQYVFDESGRRYLDAYNNVPHIGHCHPEVVDAAHRQMNLINTNTRYLHENILDFAESLANTMPDPLQVCFILNSASEANELALRMMRCVTGARDTVVLDGAYHGHTSGLIDISPYKHDGPGGMGRPDWVHVAPLADIYRGAHRDPATAGTLYAQDVQKICSQLQEQGRGVAGFIAESCPSVGGQILFPDGYLQQVYGAIRSAGGLCVADDVQTGYGRLGQAFYGFELQSVVPDIVILGKPIGNGHPLAALVTTKSIAEKFNNGMEFFSTFGGNNVSCAVGKTVLEVVQRDQLQAHALKIGERLLDGMRQLKSQFEVIGDVRGSGLFLGMELVRDHDSREPADLEASYISNRMRERGVLLGTDGPLHNVVKIRPPMPFDESNADQLLNALELSFRDLSSCR